MSATTDLLDRFKTAKKLDSDAAAGRLLRLKPSSVSNYRQGVRHAEPEVVRSMAIAINEDPELWVLRVQAERETLPERKKVWLRCIERLSTAAALCIAVFTSSHINAHSAPKEFDKSHDALCIVHDKHEVDRRLDRRNCPTRSTT